MLINKLLNCIAKIEHSYCFEVKYLLNFRESAELVLYDWTNIINSGIKSFIYRKKRGIH